MFILLPQLGQPSDRVTPIGEAWYVRLLVRAGICCELQSRSHVSILNISRDRLYQEATYDLAGDRRFP